MQALQSLIGKQIDIAISGTALPINGVLVDLGNDILVVHNGQQFIYLPIIHVQSIKFGSNPNMKITNPPETPFDHQMEKISYRKILMNAKGIFVELYITGNQSIHGYITSIMNDYFVVYSAVFHTIIVPLHHLKYLIPYHPNTTPYSLDHHSFPLKPTDMTLARTFEQQFKKFEGKIIVIDLGQKEDKIGVLKKIENNMVELATANNKAVFMLLDHVKTVHLP